MSLRIYIILLVFAPILLGAQVLSKEGRFSVDFDRGCALLEINVTELDAFGNITRQYFYEPGTPETTSTHYTYSSPGTFQIVQVVGVDVTPKTDMLTIQVFEPTEPQFRMEKCNLNSIVVTSEEQAYDSIRIYFAANDSVTLSNNGQAIFSYPSSANQSFQVRGLYKGGKPNCTIFNYRVEPLNTLATPNISNARVRETCRGFFALSLDINGFNSLVNYQVEFEQINTTIIFEGKINDHEWIIRDIPYLKQQPEYCVKINAVDICSGDVVEGERFCQATTELSVTPFENLYSTYANHGVFISVDAVTSGSLQVYRKRAEVGGFELRSTVQDAFTDPIGSLSRTYFYRIDYLDSCNEVLFSTMTNPPLLSSTRIGQYSYTIRYTGPTNYLIGSPETNYEVGNQDTSNGPIISPTFTLDLDPTDGTRQWLQAVATYKSGITLNSNIITYKYVPTIHVPNAFTPNNDDGLNDTLELFGLPTEIATTNIYTKWGQLIYTSNEPSPGWDGLINGELAPAGVYLYEVTFEGSDGAKMQQKGTFALIKK